MDRGTYPELTLGSTGFLARAGRWGWWFGGFVDDALGDVGREGAAQGGKVAPAAPCGGDDELDMGVFRLPEKAFKEGDLTEHLFLAIGVGGMEHAVEV